MVYWILAVSPWTDFFVAVFFCWPLRGNKCLLNLVFLFFFPTIDRKTSTRPRRPFEKERLDSELQLCGQYGLKSKHEVWRVQFLLSKIRTAARELLTLDEKDPRRLFEGAALIRRLIRIGVLDETKAKLDYVLSLTVSDFLERRLQTQVLKLGLAKSIHHARVLIRQRHIRYVPRPVRNKSNRHQYFTQSFQAYRIQFSAVSSCRICSLVPLLTTLSLSL